MTEPTADTGQRGEGEDKCAWCRQPRAVHGEGDNWFGHVFQDPGPDQERDIEDEDVKFWEDRHDR